MLLLKALSSPSTNNNFSLTSDPCDNPINFDFALREWSNSICSRRTKDIDFIIIHINIIVPMINHRPKNRQQIKGALNYKQIE